MAEKQPFRILSVDLTGESMEKRTLPAEYGRYLGGRGLAVKLFTDLLNYETKPLSQENMLIFTTGALINSRIPMSGRSNVTSLSPLTETVFSSNVGGMFGHNMSRTGYSGLMVVGKGLGPVYLLVSEIPSILDASDIWGKDVFETTDYLKDEHNVGEGSIAVIGPAGVNLNRFGNIMVQKHRTFGRGGLGAVMGYKNLKLSRILREKISEIDSKLKTQGTSAGVNNSDKNEAMPTRYFITSRFEYASKLNGNVMEAHKVKSGSCYSCPVACKIITRSDKYDIVTDGPEYETIVFQGSNLGISEPDTVIKSNDLCDRFGLDTISCGSLTGAFIEACQKGKIDYDISWGQGEKIHSLIHLIAYNRDIGIELQMGTDAFCGKYGIEAVTVKGLDIPGHDPRGLHGLALGYATSNRGADHLYSTTYKDEYNHPQRREIAGKAKLLIKNENRNAVLDSLGLCKFSTGFFRDGDFLDILGAYLERKVDMDEFQNLGAQVVDMERGFNNKRGFDIGHDVLPDRVRVPGLENELQEYYRQRGWSPDGKVLGK
jgi:aldehyde:ferredoxin oxidoreductase